MPPRKPSWRRSSARSVPCGIALALPPGYAGLVLPRSGLAIKRGISLVNSPGLIDSNYRGEIKAVLVNLDPRETFHVARGDRIAQLMVVRAENVAFATCAELPSERKGRRRLRKQRRFFRRLGRLAQAFAACRMAVSHVTKADTPSGYGRCAANARSMPRSRQTHVGWSQHIVLACSSHLELL